jgi:hypothetical protein
MPSKHLFRKGDIMDLIKKETLKTLSTEREEPAVSLYIPTHREWDKLNKDVILFKNNIKKLEKKLKEQNMSSREIDKFVHKAKLLIEDREFWNHQEDGLAVFISKDEFLTFPLPVAFEEQIIISHRYHLKPILPLFSGDGKYFILTLNQKEIKLYQASRFSIKEVALPKDTPLSLEEAMMWEEQKSVQFHSGTAQHTSGGPAYASTPRHSMFHGHGAGTLDMAHWKERILEFLRLAEKGVHEKLKDETAPLILCGVEYLNPLYREANTYPFLFDKVIDKNPQEYNEKELRKMGWEIISPTFEKAENDSREKYNQFFGNGLAANDLKEILRNSFSNKIEALFVDIKEQMWGKYDLQNDKLTIDNGPQPGNEDLLDLAAIQTLLEGGRIFAASKENMPNHQSIAAIYRY